MTAKLLFRSLEFLSSTQQNFCSISFWLFFFLSWWIFHYLHLPLLTCIVFWGITLKYLLNYHVYYTSVYLKDFSLVRISKHFPFSFSFSQFPPKKVPASKTYTRASLTILYSTVRCTIQIHLLPLLQYRKCWRPNHTTTCTSTSLFRSISIRQTVVKIKLYPERANKAMKTMKNTNIIILQMFIFKTGIHTQTTNPRIFEDIWRREVPNSFWQ